MGKALADAFPDLPRDVRRGRRGARRAAQPPLLRRARGSADADREHAAGDSRRQHRRVPAARVARARRRRSSPATASASTRRTSPPARSRSPTRCGSCGAAAATCRRRCRSAPARWRRSSGSTPTTVAQACAEAAEGEVVSPANLNGAGQVVIAGARDAVARAGERAKALGARRVIPLPVSAPFHCALMKPAEDRLAPELRALAVARPARAGRRQRRRRAEARRGGGDRGARSRRCRRRCAGKRSCARLASEGVTTYVEVGPGTVLSGLVRKIHREATVVELRQSRTIWRRSRRLSLDRNVRSRPAKSRS